MEPICGKLNDVVNSLWDNLLGLFGLLGLITIGLEIAKAVKGAASAAEFFGTVINFLGISAAAGFWIWAAVVYLVSVYMLFRLWYDDCVGGQTGERRCLSGVVERIASETAGWIFNASHPNLDLVVRSRYWTILQLGSDLIDCSDTGSPMLKVVFKSDRTCSVKLGALIGGAALGIGGVVVAAIAAAAIGCATVIFCVLALLVAALIVAAAVIVGALAGGAVAAGLAEDDEPEFDDGDSIQIGDYIHVEGPTAKNLKFEGAIVQYFNEIVSLLGASNNMASFRHEDPDANIPDAMDPCFTAPRVL